MGGGGRGAPPLPAPAPGPYAPRAVARCRDAAEQSSAPHVTGSFAGGPAPTADDRAAALSAPPRSRPPPLPHPCAPAAGGASHPSPCTPPRPLAPSPYQLGGEPGRPSGIGKRADTGKFWGREGRALKGPRPLFILKKKNTGWGRGERSRVAPRLNGGNNARKEWKDLCYEPSQVTASRPVFPKHPNPLSPPPPSISESHAVVWQ